MSLDVSLYITKPRKSKIRRDGKRVTYSEIYDALGIEDRSLEFKETCVFDYNITHNLGGMAGAAGIYKHLWRPEELGFTVASELSEGLIGGLLELESNPARFNEFAPSNGWGSYDGLVDFVKSYIVACEAFPEAKIHVSR